MLDFSEDYKKILKKFQVFLILLLNDDQMYL